MRITAKTINIRGSYKAVLVSEDNGMRVVTCHDVNTNLSPVKAVEAFYRPHMEQVELVKKHNNESKSTQDN